MMKWLILAFVLLSCAWTTQAEADCPGSGLTFVCHTGSTVAEIQGAINAATDGATVTFDPGAYTITSQLSVSTARGITLICATAPLANGAATVNPCAVTVNGNTNIGSSVFGNATYNQCYRFSGFLFDLSGSLLTGGIFRFDNHAGAPRPAFARSTLTCLRFDHNTFQNGGQSATIYKFGQVGVAAPDTTPFNVGNYYGVADHNTYTGSRPYIVVYILNNLDFSPPAAQAGTGNNFFIEDSIFSFSLGGNNNAGCSDGWGGFAVVWRFNTALNCRFPVHGEKHEGGPNNLEFYGNQLNFDAGMADSGSFFQNGTWAVQHQGSGEMLVFNNSFLATIAPQSTWVIESQNYRDSHTGDSTNFSPDLGGPIPFCDGTVTNFGAGLAPPLNPQGGIIADGNRTPLATYRGYPCWHQMGRDRAHVLKPVYLWNNYFADTLQQAPFLLNNIGGSPDYFSEHAQQNRDWYQAVSASAQSSPTSPFNGTTEMGFGTLANRPTTCTPTPEALDAGNGGVGYWATDQGSWKNGTPSQGVWTAGEQGVLFRCKATNTWTTVDESYHPYAYPHPLTTVVSQVRGPAISGGLRFTGGVRF
jgi:hypothetical protein